MIRFLVKTFIPNAEAVQLPDVRMAYGKLGSVVGIISNILLALSKVLIGLLSQSVSITADGINNLSDAGSSIITFMGFKLSSKPADEDHPFGHARIEYISALIVSFLILFLGIELIKSSIDKILHPQPVTFSIILIIVLGLSIIIKLWLSRFNKTLGDKIDSTAMRATATDSMNDVVATSVVLISLLISKWTGFNIDGYMGLAVALFIIYSGINIIRETVSPLLGEAPSAELVELVESKLKSYTGVLGMHDLVIHNYGPNRCFATVHIEVPCEENILESHDMIDNIERDFINALNIHLVIHLDPIITDDETTLEVKRFLTQEITSIDPRLSMHDFRMVSGNTHTNLIFDIVVPTNFSVSNKDLLDQIEAKVKEKNPSYYAVVTLDTNYITKPLNEQTKDL